jgi:hypothetical protein
MKNKRVVLINSYCDNEIKINVLIKNIEKIKKNDLDVFLLSPIDLPQSVISLCDLYVQTKENPITTWPDKSMFEYKGFWIDNIFYELNVGKPDYGWASLYQLKKISQIALTYDYEYFFNILYDTKLDDFLLSYFNTNEKCILFPTNKGFVVGGFFMGFNREILSTLEKLITKDLYYNNHDVAETILVNISKVLPCKICNEITEDEIYYFSNQDLFNYSKFNNFKIFIHKRTGEKENLKLFFYDMLSTYEISINVNQDTKNYIISNHDLIDLGIDWSCVDNLSISYNNETQNLNEDYNNISHNTIRITSTN